MTTVHHVLCGSLHVPPYGTAICHGLLLEGPAGLALVDPGIGLLDARDPDGRVGRELIDLAGFQFDEASTAVRRIEALGLRPGDVKAILLTHADPDHAGALADFPEAQVHVSEEERVALSGGNPRYVPIQFAHGPRWETHGPSPRRWFGLEARPVDPGTGSEVLLVPLPGHTLGHCGVAIAWGDGRWLLHAGDAYYLRAELSDDAHPAGQLAAIRADDDARRRESLEAVRRLVRDHPGEVDVVGYHDPAEFPADMAAG